MLIIYGVLWFIKFLFCPQLSLLSNVFIYFCAVFHVVWAINRPKNVIKQRMQKAVNHSKRNAARYQVVDV